MFNKSTLFVACALISGVMFFIAFGDAVDNINSSNESTVLFTDFSASDDLQNACVEEFSSRIEPKVRAIPLELDRLSILELAKYGLDSCAKESYKEAIPKLLTAGQEMLIPAKLSIIYTTVKELTSRNAIKARCADYVQATYLICPVLTSVYITNK